MAVHGKARQAKPFLLVTDSPVPTYRSQDT